MEKHILPYIFALLFGIHSASADQLCYLSKQAAEKAASQLNERSNKKIVIFCACCEDGEPQIIDAKQIYAEYTGIQKYYQVCIKDKDGKTYKLDLAYVFVPNEDDTTYRNVGKMMEFNCYPCIKDGFSISKRGKIKNGERIAIDDDME